MTNLTATAMKAAITKRESRTALYRVEGGLTDRGKALDVPWKYAHVMRAKKTDPLWLRTLAAVKLGAAIDGKKISIPLATVAISKGTIVVAIPLDEVDAYSYNSTIYLPLRQIAYDFNKQEIVPFVAFTGRGRPLSVRSAAGQLFGRRSGKGSSFLNSWLFASEHGGSGSLWGALERESLIDPDSILSTTGGSDPEWLDAHEWLPELFTDNDA